MLMQTGKTQTDGPVIDSKRSLEFLTVGLTFEERFMADFHGSRHEILDSIRYLGGLVDYDFLPELRFARGVMTVYVYCSIAAEESEAEVMTRVDAVVRLWHIQLLTRLQQEADKELALAAQNEQKGWS